MKGVEEDSINSEKLNRPETIEGDQKFQEDIPSTEGNKIKVTAEPLDNEKSSDDDENSRDSSEDSHTDIESETVSGEDAKEDKISNTDSMMKITSTSEKDNLSPIKQENLDDMQTDNDSALNEEVKDTVTVDSVNDSQFDEPDIHGTATSQPPDNDQGPGNPTKKSKKKKNKKKRKKDREKVNQENSQLQNNNAGTITKQTETKETESKQSDDKETEVVKDQEAMAKTQENESEGRVFGLAKRWTKSQTSHVSPSDKSSLFHHSNNNTENNLFTRKTEDEKTTGDAGDPLLDPDQNTDTDESKSCSDAEKYTDEDNDNGNNEENEQLQEESQAKDLRESHVKETNIDTGKTVHVSGKQKKKKKKKKKKKNKVSDFLTPPLEVTVTTVWYRLINLTDLTK